MIPNKICEKIIVVGPELNGKGGISSVVASHKSMMGAFNFIPLTAKGIAKIYLPLLAIFRSFKYLSNKYKAVHIHSASYKDFYRNSFFIIWFKLLRKEIILHMHGAKFDEFYLKHRSFVNFICRKADLMLSVSTYYKRFFEENKLAKNVKVLHNSIEPSKFVRQNMGSLPVTFSFMGALDDRKGIFDVLETIGQNKSLFEGRVKLEIAGDGDLDRMRSIIDRYSLNEIVNFHGWISSTEKAELLIKSDVFIHPSSFESFGISILEAMDFGLPIITTNVGGIPDLVTNGENGIVVSAGDKEQIKNAMVTLIEDVDLRVNLGRESSLKAKNFYTEHIERNLKEIYEQI